MQTAAGQSGAETHAVRAEPRGERAPIRKASWTSMAFRSILSKILAQLGGRPGALCALTVGPPRGLHLNETRERTGFFPGPFSLALLLFFSHLGSLGGLLLLKYLVLPNLINKLNASGK